MPERQQSPQERVGCACPRWSTGYECMIRRYAPDDMERHSGRYEDCECACHEVDDEYDDDREEA